MALHNDRPILIATRGSALALAQATQTRQVLADALKRDVNVESFITTGDRKTEWSLEKEGGKGLFTKELEDALLEGRADVAVHSAKDLPTDLPEGLVIGAYLPRQVPFDVLVSRKADITALEIIATGSPRRRTQLKAMYPHVVWEEMRGNVETRLKKVAGSDSVDATVLAAAGLNRLGIDKWEGLSFTQLTVDQVVPAAGQGAIALQCRAEDAEVLAAVNDADTWRAVTIERAFLKGLGGGCHSSTAAYFDCTEDKLHVYAEEQGRGCYIIHATDEAEILKEVDDVVDKFLSRAQGGASPI